MAADEHPRIKLTPETVTRLRAWMVARNITGSAEELLGGILAAGGDETITDTVIDEIMATIDNLRAWHGHAWRDVLRVRADGAARGVPPIEPLSN